MFDRAKTLEGLIENRDLSPEEQDIVLSCMKATAAYLDD
jgi:hypothetical protein